MYKRVVLISVAFLSLLGCSSSVDQTMVCIPASSEIINTLPEQARSPDESIVELAAPSAGIELFSDERSGSQILIVWDGIQASFDWDYCTPRGTEVDAILLDLNQDGEEELIVSVLSGTGTGVNYHELHVIERGSDQNTWMDLTLPDLVFERLMNELSYEINNQEITFSIGGASCTVKTDFMISGIYPIGHIVTYTLSEDGIRASFGVAVESDDFDFPEGAYVATLTASVKLEDENFVISDYIWA